MAILKKLGVLSVAKLQAILMAFFGLLIGIFMAVLGAAIGAGAGSLGLGAGLGFLGIIAFPIFYGILGFISGAIFAFLYNLIASWVGGIDMEFEK